MAPDLPRRIPVNIVAESPVESGQRLRLRLRVPSAMTLRIQATDVAGRVVATLEDRTYLTGTYTLELDAGGRPGVLFLSGIGRDHVIAATARVVVLK